MSGKAKLILSDGTVFSGRACGATGTSIGELIFDTAMSGYQEALTDPTFSGQIVMMTYPLIGNCGINDEDNETDTPYLHGLVVKELTDYPNNYRMTTTIADFLKEKNIIAIEGVDTRAITRKIRNEGSMLACITTEDLSFDDVKAQFESFSVPNAVAAASCKEIYSAGEGNLSVALIDYGQKKGIIESLVKRGVRVTVYPHNTKADIILSGSHNGIMLSSGGAEPNVLCDEIAVLKELINAKLPIFAVSLGHILLAMANGANAVKLPYGHHGANHPVTDNKTGKTYITAQNHSFCVDIDSIDKTAQEVRFVNLNDKTCEGIVYKNIPALSVQFSPEGGPGPKETGYLFDEFIAMMGGKANA